ncbi:MAG TPA: patatin-like phospholipase family protein [Patescibacteria group bacterium]|nr:patatin-like phospholipase family protein [Patescibacteria group bacterium]
MRSRLLTALTAVFAITIAGCATYPANPRLVQYDTKSGYRFENLTASGNSDSLFVILTFSGGGTRAAALSYGVMEKLRDVKIRWEGEERRLLDEVDAISSVSGGSFTAAYYALFRDELFDPEKFRKVFLYRDIEAELKALLFNPINWVRLASPTFGRIELAAELYDREIFRAKSFGDLINQAHRPFTMINATDITMGSRFTFIQDQFDLLCSDLSGVQVARAVAASSNFPIAFSPLTVNNYAGTCRYREPPWMDEASKDLLPNPPRFNRARIARSYLNQGKRKYIHLLDGGVADNIGLRGPLVSIRSNDPSWSLPNKINLGKVKRLLAIVVDARTDPKTAIDKKPSGPGLRTIVDIIASVPMANYSFDTVQELLDEFNRWRKDRKFYASCTGILESACPAAHMPTGPPPPIETYGLYVGFDQIKDTKERDYFLNLPTTFHLSQEAVDKLRAIGPKILEESEEFQRLLQDLHSEGG